MINGHSHFKIVTPLAEALNAKCVGVACFLACIFMDSWYCIYDRSHEKWASALLYNYKLASVIREKSLLITYITTII